MTAGLLVMALLPVAAAVSAEPAAPTQVPVAIAQPLAAIGPLGSNHPRMLPESGLMVLVGTALMALAAIVRRTTKT